MQNEESRMQKLGAECWLASAGLLLLPMLCSTVVAEDFAVLVQDRTAVERVHYNHRLGQKPSFEQVSPPTLIGRSVKQDLRKEVALNVEVTPALLRAEVRRINTTTRAPDVLAEIKAALGNDSAKFALVFAKPILVERLLREKFENDDTLHAAQRRQAETLRGELLEAGARLSSTRQVEAPAGKSGDRSPKAALAVSNAVAILKASPTGQFSETTWQLGAPPAARESVAGPDELEIKQRFGPDAQIISSPQGAKDRKSCFQDLPAELQRVLRVQLRQPGDVSAVIETPGGFLLYVAKEKTDTALTVACLSLPKRNYEQWLAEQGGGMK